MKQRTENAESTVKQAAIYGSMLLCAVFFQPNVTVADARQYNGPEDGMKNYGDGTTGNYR